MSTNVILEVKNVKKFFPIRSGFFLRHTGDVRAVDGVSFKIKRGETLGLVGESGCGKSTLGRTIIRLYDPTAGQIDFKGRDMANVQGGELRTLRKNMQMIFQDPYASLNPRHTVGQIISEPLQVHGVPKEEMETRVRDLMGRVGLNPTYTNRYPHEFSGGQRQRISIARAIAIKPDLVIADEPVSALDVSIQAQVLNLMKDLQDELGLTYLFISHDLGVVEHMCNTVAVMYLGKIVEIAPRDELFKSPLHPYTRALMNAVPRVGVGKKHSIKALRGDVPSPIKPPSGCAFHPRCAHAMPQCKTTTPELKSSEQSTSEHQVSCWLYK
jgi:oligopeptide transport system ATP-binding protein